MIYLKVSISTDARDLKTAFEFSLARTEYQQSKIGAPQALNKKILIKEDFEKKDQHLHLQLVNKQMNYKT